MRPNSWNDEMAQKMSTVPVGVTDTRRAFMKKLVGRETGCKSVDDFFLV
jgi:hypothetical protein